MTGYVGAKPDLSYHYQTLRFGGINGDELRSP